MNVPNNLTVSPFVVQQVPLIANAICKEKDWEEIANTQAEHLKQAISES